MKEQKRFNVIPAVFIIFLLAFVATYLLLSNTMRSMDEASEREALSLLSENAVQMERIFENQLSNNWKHIGMVSRALNHMQDSTNEEIVNYLQVAMPDTYNILLLSDDGIYIDKSGKQGMMEITKDLLPLAQGEEHLLFLSQKGNMDMLTFGTVIDPITIDGIRMNYLFVYYSLDEYMDLLKMESFEGKGKIRIINGKGATLLHTDNVTRSENRYLFFSGAKDAEFMNHPVVKDYDSFKEYVLSGKTDAIRMVLATGADVIVSFTKIPDTDWFIIVSIEHDVVVGTRTTNLRQIGKMSLMSVMVIVVISLSLVFLILSLSQKKTKAKNRELEQLNLQLQHANRAKSIFLSNMSHDIRTPMNAVIGFTTLAAENVENTQLVRDYLTKILSASKHLLSLINDILDMSRIESGKLRLEETETNLSDIITNIKAILSGKIKEKQLKFYVNVVNVTNTEVHCDKTRLNQILLNLLSNSVKFTPEGGTITLTLTQKKASEELGEYEIRVKDTGIGMSQEFVEHIFETFERERSSTVSGIQGTGLGMPICKNLVELMGGTILVDTEKDKGTEVVVSLPLSIVKGSKKGSNEDLFSVGNIKGAFKGKRVLLVEDDEMNMEIASEIFGSYGFEIDRAENGKEALDKITCANVRYDLICMDIHMPVMDGYEAVRHIRNMDNPELSQLPIIIMTANAYDEDRQMAKACGVNGFITKPFDTKEIINALKNVFNKNIMT